MVQAVLEILEAHTIQAMREMRTAQAILQMQAVHTIQEMQETPQTELPAHTTHTILQTAPTMHTAMEMRLQMQARRSQIESREERERREKKESVIIADLVRQWARQLQWLLSLDL